MNANQPTRKERRYFRDRGEIIDAALTLFSEKGFHAVTMQQIARAAEFSVGKLYTFFANKKDLYQALIREKARVLHDELMAILSQEDDEPTLIRRANARRMELFLNNTDAIRLYLSETIGAGFSLRAGLNREVRIQYDALLQAVSRLFAKGMEKGVFVAGDPYQYAVALDGMTNALVMSHMENPQQRAVDPEMVCRLFFKGILVHPGGGDA